MARRTADCGPESVEVKLNTRKPKLLGQLKWKVALHRQRILAWRSSAASDSVETFRNKFHLAQTLFKGDTRVAPGLDEAMPFKCEIYCATQWPTPAHSSRSGLLQTPIVFPEHCTARLCLKACLTRSPVIGRCKNQRLQIFCVSESLR